MPAAYLHGVETVETVIGPQTISVVKSAVIGIVGVAPPWVVNANNPGAVVPPGNDLTLCRSKRDDGLFGPLVSGWDIPDALYKIHLQGAGECLVVNVFNWATHATAVPMAPFTFNANDVLSLNQMFVTNVVVTNGSTITYALNADYSIDPNNGFLYRIPGGGISVGGTVQVSFSYADPTKVLEADIVGSTLNSDYSGIQNFLTAFSEFGFFPKMLIAPSWSTNPAVAAELEALCGMMRSITFLDDYSGGTPQSVQGALSDRANVNSVMNISSTRVGLCYPRVGFFDISIDPTDTVPGPTGAPLYTYINALTYVPFSTFVAGAQAAKDVASGYWYSVSNTQLIGVQGAEVSLYASMLDADSDTNALNGAGIITIFPGTPGQKVWGNRSSAFPVFTTPDVILAVRRGMDILEESVMLAMMQELDKPITNSFLTHIVGKTNGLLHTLIQRGALVGGSCTYDPNDNPPDQLAAGHVTFELDVMPPPPAERITFNVFIDTTLLSSLSGTTAVQNATGVSTAATTITVA